MSRGGSAARQERALGAQLDLACARGLPAVLHVVRCHDRLLELLRARDVLPRFLLHGWSGPEHLMPHLVALGGWFSFGPRVTRDGHAKLKRSLRWVASEHPGRWLIETDAPDAGLSPGARGEPGDLAAVAAAVAVALCRDEASVGDVTSRNAETFYSDGAAWH